MKVNLEKITKGVGAVCAIGSLVVKGISEISDILGKKKPSENSGMIASQNSQDSDKTKV